MSGSLAVAELKALQLPLTLMVHTASSLGQPIVLSSEFLSARTHRSHWVMGLLLSSFSFARRLVANESRTLFLVVIVPGEPKSIDDGRKYWSNFEDSYFGPSA